AGGGREPRYARKQAGSARQVAEGRRRRTGGEGQDIYSRTAGDLEGARHVHELAGLSGGPARLRPQIQPAGGGATGQWRRSEGNNATRPIHGGERYHHVL